MPVTTLDPHNLVETIADHGYGRWLDLSSRGVDVTLIIAQQVDDEVIALAASAFDRVLVLLAVPPADRMDLWRLLSAGVDELIIISDDTDPKPDIESRIEMWAEVDILASSALARSNLLGESPRWRRTVRDIAHVALHAKGPIVIEGETGTGKELAARFLHAVKQLRKERKGRLIVVDATTIVPTLSGSELFGHVKGAYTGAERARQGAFELADGGSVFLDEVGELPIDLQVELLRVVQEGTFRKVGSNDWIDSRFDLICATNRHLVDLVDSGRFRADLYHRVASTTLRLPPLRDRPGDVGVLAEHFVARESGGKCELDRRVIAALSEYRFPGNVRELEQICRHMVMSRGSAGCVTVADLPSYALDLQHDREEDDSSDWLAEGVHDSRPLDDLLSETRTRALQVALETESQNGRRGLTARVAMRLGISERRVQQLSRKLEASTDNVGA